MRPLWTTLFALCCAACTETTRPAPTHAVVPAKPTPPTVERPCASGHRAKLDVDRWIAEASTAKTPGEADAVLARLFATPLSKAFPETHSNPAIEFVDSHVLPLSLDQQSAGSDRLVALEFRSCPDPYFCLRHQRFILLLTLDNGESCVVEHDLDLDQDSSEKACLSGPEPEHDEPRAIFPRKIVDAANDTLVVSTQSGRCDGVGRGARWTTAYYQLLDGRLSNIFERVVYAAEYASPIPPLREEAVLITPEGQYPRNLEVVERVECPDHRDLCAEAPEACHADTRFFDPQCEPLESRSTYRFDGKQYVLVP